MDLVAACQAGSGRVGSGRVSLEYEVDLRSHFTLGLFWK